MIYVTVIKKGLKNANWMHFTNKEWYAYDPNMHVKKALRIRDILVRILI
jgi:hypothetical protein